MGMYGDALNKLDDGLYVKLEAGRTVTLRILEHPYVASKRYPDGNVATRFFWIVWDYNLQMVRIMEQGKSVFQQIAKKVEKWPQGETMPAPFDVAIDREGTGQNDTKYFVDSVPHSGTMPPSVQLKDKIAELRKLIIAKNNAIPLQEILSGSKPQVVEAGSVEPKSPTLAALESGEEPSAEGDVVIKDLDESKEINLDDIPY